MPALLALLAPLFRITINEAKAWARWARQMVLLAARNLRALLVWVAAHTAARVACAAAAVLAFEGFTIYITSHVITPLARDFIQLCIPAGTDADGFVWILWDSGLNGRAIFNAFVLYLANYTALWYAFDRWLRLQAVALSTYRQALRHAKAVRDTSLLT